MRVIYSKNGEFGGWYADTRKDPLEVLSSIANSAMLQECGYIGYQWANEREHYDKTILKFEGIQVCIIDANNPRWSKIKNESRFSFCLEITDREKIHPGFLDLWLFFVASKDVTGGPAEKDRKYFSGNTNKSKGDDLQIEKSKKEFTTWEEEWIVKLSHLSMSTIDRIKYLFLFAVKMNQGSFKPLAIKFARVKPFPEIDKILNTGTQYQELAKQYFDMLRADGVKVEKEEVTGDILGFTDALYKYFYHDHRKEFTYPNFPKKQKKQKAP